MCFLFDSEWHIWLVSCLSDYDRHNILTSAMNTVMVLLVKLIFRKDSIINNTNNTLPAACLQSAFHIPCQAGQAGCTLPSLLLEVAWSASRQPPVVREALIATWAASRTLRWAPQLGVVLHQMIWKWRLKKTRQNCCECKVPAKTSGLEGCYLRQVASVKWPP